MRNSRIPFSIDAIDSTIPDRFDRVVRTFPDHPAVRSSPQAYTYQELNAKANQIAGILIKAGGKKGRTVSILHGFQPEIVAAILGVLKAGMIYVVLEPNQPKTRLQIIGKDAHTEILLTDKENHSLALEVSRGEFPVINLASINSEVIANVPGLELQPFDPAAIYYTTGTTGQPKGILRNHRDLLFRGWTFNDLYKIGKEDRVSQVFLFSFAASTSDMFGTILNGGTLCLHDIRNSTLQQTMDWLVNERISIFHPPLAFFRKMLDNIDGREILSGLRMLLLGGASLYKGDIEQAREILPLNCVICNRFSSTEVGLTANYFIDKKTRIEGDIVPIGYPVMGVEIFVLDETGQVVEPGEVGEIAVKSRFLSTGYWQDPGNTDKQYLNDGSDRTDLLYLTNDLGQMDKNGLLIHLGRKDSIAKVRGYRVDITEVEAALASHDAIHQLAVLARPVPGSEENRLVAYYVLKQASGPHKRELRDFLEQKIPSYMIPTSFVMLESMPLNSNGKIDVSALPDSLDTTDSHFLAPRDELEKRIANIWSQTLQIEKIGIHDNFFELGGDSLQAIVLAGKLKKELDFNTQLTTLFEVPTIAHQSDILRKEKQS